MSEPMKLTLADHVMIHACGALLTQQFRDDGRDQDDDMVRSILNDVLIDVSVDHPSLQPFIEIARELAHAQTAVQIHTLRSRHAGLIRNFHRQKMATAFDLIRERYRND